MTRCYEFYKIVNSAIEEGSKDLPLCKDKSITNVFYIKKYIKMLKEHGVKLDGSKEDKQTFTKVKGEIGSERPATRQTYLAEPVVDISTLDCRKQGVEQEQRKPMTTWKNERPCPYCNKMILVEKRGDRYILEKKPLIKVAM